MLGKIKAYASVHPMRLVLLVVLVLYPIMRAVGLPNVLITSDQVIMMACTFVFCHVIVVFFMKHLYEVNRAVEWLYTKLGLTKRFGKICKLSRFDVMIRKIHLCKVAEEKRHYGTKVRENWMDIFDKYVIQKISVTGEQSVEFDSYDFAAMVAFAMIEGTINTKKISIIYGVIKDLLLNPVSCQLTIDAFDGYKLECDLIDVYKESPKEENIFTRREFKKTVMMILNCSLPRDVVDVYEIYILAKNLRERFLNAYMF